MNILFLCGDDPRCVTNGTCQRTNAIWRALQTFGTVYTCVSVSGPRARAVVDVSARIRTVNLDSPAVLGRALQILFEKLTKVGSWPFRSKRIVQEQLGWHGLRFDLVVGRYLVHTAKASLWHVAPCCVDVDDLPLEAFRLQSHRLPWLLRLPCKWLVSLWQRYCLSRCGIAWLANPCQVPKGTNVRALPNIAREPGSHYCLDGRQESLLLTVGLMSYAPNFQGVDWFVQTIWPTFYVEHPDFTYYIVGRGAPQDMANRWSRVPGVKVLGFVDDIDTLYERSMAVVSPVLSGAGTCIKVIEAGLRGRMVFATPVAARGVQDSGSANWLSVFSTAAEFCCGLDRWLGMSAARRAELQRECAGYVSLRFSFSSFCASVGNAIKELRGR